MRGWKKSLVLNFCTAISDQTSVRAMQELRRKNFICKNIAVVCFLKWTVTVNKSSVISLNLTVDRLIFWCYNLLAIRELNETSAERKSVLL